MFECPNCGGNLKFDIPSQQLDCEFCHGKFDPYAFETKQKDAEETVDEFEATIFSCPQCGGELLSTDNASAAFCSFCGASTVLFSRISNEKRPKYIIPFRKTKEECKQAYADLMKRAIFAPNDMKNPESIDSFRGIYMPYWAFHITQDGPIAIPAERSHRRGDYIIHDHYNITGEMEAYYKGLYYDASSSFSDNISANIAPYDVKGMKAFTPSYFSGFYADTSDVDSAVYEADAQQFAMQTSMENLQKTAPFRDYSLDLPIVSDPAFLGTKTKEVDSAVFPVWFMSYRNGNRVAYATVNGQTGKVVADIPVDKKKYLLGSLILAIPLFLLFELFLTLLPSTLLIIVSILALVTGIIYNVQTSQIHKKDSGQNDKGYLFRHNPINNDGIPVPGQQKKPAGNNFLVAILFIYIFVLFLGGFDSLFSGTLFGMGLLWLVLTVMGLIVGCCGSMGMQKIEKEDQHRTGFFLMLVAHAISCTIGLLRPVSDIFYYTGVLLLLISMILVILDIISYYNVLSTRKLPQFEKKGGDDRA